MRLLEHDTRRSTDTDRISAWSSKIDAAFGPFVISRYDPEQFAGRLRVERRADIRFIELDYVGHGFSRRRSDVSRLGEAYCSLIRPTRGRLHHSQFGAIRVLEPGRFYVVNHAVPYETLPEDAYGTVAIAFPPSALESRVARPEGFYSLDGDVNSPRNSLLAAYFDHFVAGRETWTDREFEQLSTQLIDLIVLTMVESGSGASTGESAARTAHRERALRYIRVHLAERTLTPPTVAEACGISLSYLHDLFRSTGRSVEDTIFAERLDRARVALEAPELASLQIATIAYRHGFSDPAHFTRAFRRRFGMTPGDARQAGVHGRSSIDRRSGKPKICQVTPPPCK